MRKLFLCALVALAAMAALGAVVVSSAGAARPLQPPTLVGVSFSGTPTFSNASCSANGNGSFDYAVSGTASGPYAGTYSETGTVTVGPGSLNQLVHNPNPGPLETSYTLEWYGDGVATGQATFSIDSPAGMVSGSKTWSVLTGSCTSTGRVRGQLLGIAFDATVLLLLNQAYSDGSGLNSYGATIESGRRTYCDSGTTELNAGVFEAYTSTPLGFDLTLASPSYSSTFASAGEEVSRAHPKGGCG
jgi:hypothetical protein